MDFVWVFKVFNWEIIIYGALVYSSFPFVYIVFISLLQKIFPSAQGRFCCLFFMQTINLITMLLYYYILQSCHCHTLNTLQS